MTWTRAGLIGAAAACLAAAVFVGIGVIGTADGQTQKPRKAPTDPSTQAPQSQQSPAPPTAAQQAANQPTVPAQQALARGFKTCIGALDSSARSLVQATPYGALSTWNNRNADGRTFSTVIATEDPASTVFLTEAPTRDGGCDSIAERIVPLTQTCVAFREQSLAGWKLAWEASKSMTAYSGPDGRTVFLMQGQAGCVAIERQIAYGMPGG
ncbi:MAG TPA: hypothetical protein VEU47_07440 [Candidatus Cybelea sp.]|nr:hypothetical protein [Candidatus Cybelea sp.]